MKSNYSYTGYNSKLLTNARHLRKRMTPQEQKLWFCFLRQYPVKWYRQRVIERFIADFYCSKAKLVVEIDGARHYDGSRSEYDKIRTKYINEYEIEVIRFSNKDIDKNFNSVCRIIDAKVKENLLLQIAQK